MSLFTDDELNIKYIIEDPLRNKCHDLEVNGTSITPTLHVHGYVGITDNKVGGWPLVNNINTSFTKILSAGSEVNEGTTQKFHYKISKYPKTVYFNNSFERTLNHNANCFITFL